MKILILIYGFDPALNKGEVFVELTQKLDLSLPTEKAGGLITPNTSIDGLSRALGPVADLENMKLGKFDPKALFENAKFLGGITLKDILKSSKF